jgi:hypothetical protein
MYLSRQPSANGAGSSQLTNTIIGGKMGPEFFLPVVTTLVGTVAKDLAEDLFRWIKAHPRWVYVVLAVQAIIGVVFIGAMYELLSYISPKLPEFFDAMQQHPAVLSALVMAAGLVFYLLRWKYRVVYAMVEISVGIALAVKAVDTPTSDVHGSLLATASLLSAIYIHIRAFDNFAQAYKDAKEATEKARAAVLARTAATEAT